MKTYQYSAPNIVECKVTNILKPSAALENAVGYPTALSNLLQKKIID
jgi:hypothetical protein